MFNILHFIHSHEKLNNSNKTSLFFNDLQNVSQNFQIIPEYNTSQ